jgi:hypothetical protein
MASSGKSLTFEPEEIEELVSMQYGDKRLFALLSLLFPFVDLRNQFHIDHVFPISRFTGLRLSKAGVPESKVEGFVELANSLGNLQLLEGAMNVEKRAALPAEWLASQAYTGYLDQGGGRPKVPDPDRAPHVRGAFELYATGRYSLHSLTEELRRRGFRNSVGKTVGVNRLSSILRNPFYMGVIRMKRSGESYAGVPEPIIAKSLFDRVQDILDGKLNARPLVHDFLFRRMITCVNCGYRLIGETRKGVARQSG